MQRPSIRDPVTAALPTRPARSYAIGAKPYRGSALRSFPSGSQLTTDQLPSHERSSGAGAACIHRTLFLGQSSKRKPALRLPLQLIAVAARAPPPAKRGRP